MSTELADYIEDGYCPVCKACGEEGCCSALMCRQDKDGSFCSIYLQHLRFGYRIARALDEKLYPELSPELKQIYDQCWEEEYGEVYSRCNYSGLPSVESYKDDN